jgi:hypothetical protein
MNMRRVECVDTLICIRQAGYILKPDIKNFFFLIFSIGWRLFFQSLERGSYVETFFQRFFGLPQLPTPRGRLSIAIFARRLSSILSTWASHSLLRTLADLIISWIPLSCRSWSLRILCLSVFPCIYKELMFDIKENRAYCVCIRHITDTEIT